MVVCHCCAYSEYWKPNYLLWIINICLLIFCYSDNKKAVNLFLFSAEVLDNLSLRTRKLTVS